MLDARSRSFTPATIRSYESNLRRFFTFLAERRVSPENVNTTDLKAFLAFLKEQGFVEETLLNNFSTLSSYYDFLLADDNIPRNPIVPFRKRYLRIIARDRESHRSQPRRQVPDAEGVKAIVLAAKGKRDRAVLLTLLKTGTRREELVQVNLEDVDVEKMTIWLHPHRKRANVTVFFDLECQRALREWLVQRDLRFGAKGEALFLNAMGGRLDRSGVYGIVVAAATRAGLHNPKSQRPEDRFTPHHCRHWFTSVLLNGGMPRQLVQWLRGDHAREAVDQYFHPDQREIRRRYEATMPVLGIYAD